jgi:hypothetical protein
MLSQVSVNHNNQHPFSPSAASNINKNKIPQHDISNNSLQHVLLNNANPKVLTVVRKASNN